MRKNELMRWTVFAAIAGIGGSQVQQASAAGFLYNAVEGVNSPPGTPNEVQIKINGPTSLSIQFHNTATGSGECVRFEFSTKVNGQIVNPADNPATPYPGYCVFGTTQYLTRPLPNLQPETEYCFQIWSRKEGNEIRSEKPSAWACGRTPPFAPLAPLDVKAFMTSVAASSPPRLSWNAPDQSNHRGITRFMVERQTSPGPNRPWVSEGAVDGPAGNQSASTRLAFAFAASVIDPKVPQIYRVCAENDGGRTCAAPVTLEVKAPELATGVSLNDPIASATVASNRSGFSSLSPQAKANVLANLGRTSQANSRPAAPPPTQSPATIGVTTKLSPQLLAAAKSSVGSTLQGGSAQTPPSASPSMTTTSSGSASSPGGGGGGRSAVATSPVNAAPAPAPVGLAALVRESDLPRGLARLNDNAIIIVGGKQLRAGEVKQEVLKLDDHVMLKVGGQHLRASRLKHELTQTRRSANWGEVPGQKTALNPQPLPPKPPAQTTPNSQFSAPGSALQK